MTKRATALAEVLSPQEEELIRLTVVEGLSAAKAAEQLGIHKITAYDWLKRERVKLAIKELLAGARTKNQTLAYARLDKAWQTIDNAMKNPMVSPTQLKAAALVLMHANGGDKLGDSSPVIHVEVNTQLNSSALAEQQQRHSQPPKVYEGAFEVIEDE